MSQINFFFLLISFFATLSLAACQSERSSDQTGTRKTSSTMRHLQQDKRLDQQISSGSLSVNLIPAPLHSGDLVRAVISNCDKDVDIEWRINDNPLSGIYIDVLPENMAKRGDRVAVSVRCGTKQAMNLSEVINSPPIISEVQFEQEQLIAGEPITLRPVADDADNDLINFTYEWVVNDEIVTDTDESTLDAEYTIKGNRITVSVTPFDGLEYGASFDSHEFIIPNSAPIITSTPLPLRDKTYSYNVRSTDVDNDTLTYKLLKGPENMTIDQAGHLTWTIPSDFAEDLVSIEITVKDPDGAEVRQSFNLSFDGDENK